jgi:hypothetical protein
VLEEGGHPVRIDRLQQRLSQLGLDTGEPRMGARRSVASPVGVDLPPL